MKECNHCGSDYLLVDAHKHAVVAKCAATELDIATARITNLEAELAEQTIETERLQAGHRIVCEHLEAELAEQTRKAFILEGEGLRQMAGWIAEKKKTQELEAQLEAAREVRSGENLSPAGLRAMARFYESHAAAIEEDNARAPAETESKHLPCGGCDNHADLHRDGDHCTICLANWPCMDAG